MEEKLTEALEKIDVFITNNRSLIKWAGAIGAVLFLLNVASNFFGYRALKKLDAAQEDLKEAQNKIGQAQENIDVVLKYVQEEKKRNEYYKTQFDVIQQTIKFYEAKNQTEKKEIESNLNVLKHTIDSLSKELGFK